MSVIQAQQVVTLLSPLTSATYCPVEPTWSLRGSHIPRRKYLIARVGRGVHPGLIRRGSAVMEMRASAPSSRNVGSGLPEKGPGGTEKWTQASPGDFEVRESEALALWGNRYS